MDPSRITLREFFDHAYRPLCLAAARGWSLSQTAKVFLLMAVLSRHG